MSKSIKLSGQREVEVVYEDDDLLIINKPAHLLAVPDRWDKTKENVMGLLKDKFSYIANAHRLDQDTSGIMVMAKTPAALSFLINEFRVREVEKTYLALVHGALPQPHLTIDFPLANDFKNPGLSIVVKSGKPSITEFEVVEQYRGHSLIKAKPKTGRLHQIRVHLRSIGCPVVADKNYGDGQGLFLSQLKRNYKETRDLEKPLIDRLALHAEHIRLAHPTSGQPLECYAPLFKDMTLAMKYLKKYTLA